eukprot:gene2292-4458_t
MSIHGCVKDGNLPEVLMLLDTNPQLINSMDQNGSTILSIASWCGHVNMARLLINRGADLNVQDDRYNTALMWSVVSDHSEISKLLIASGSNIDAQNQTGMTALLWSILKGQTEITNLLIQRGSAAINLQDSNGYNPLILASREGQDDVVHHLLENHAVVNATSNDGYSALMWAIENLHLNIVNNLLMHGASTNILTANGDTMLIMACSSGNPDIVARLLQDMYIQDVNAQGYNGDSALIRASMKGFIHIAIMLLERKANVNIKNNSAVDVAVSEDIHRILTTTTTQTTSTTTTTTATQMVPVTPAMTMAMTTSSPPVTMSMSIPTFVEERRPHPEPNPGVNPSYITNPGVNPSYIPSNGNGNGNGIGIGHQTTHHFHLPSPSHSPSAVENKLTATTTTLVKSNSMNDNSSNNNDQNVMEKFLPRVNVLDPLSSSRNGEMERGQIETNTSNNTVSNGTSFQMKQQIQLLTAKIQEYENELEASKIDSEKLISEVDTFKSLSTNLTAELQVAVNDIEKLQWDLSATSSQSMELKLTLETRINHLQSDLKTMSSTTKEKEAKIDSLLNELNQLRVNSTSSISNISLLEKEIGTKNNELRNIRAELEQYKSLVNSKEIELNTCNTDKLQLQNSLSDHMKHTSEIDSLVSSQRHEITMLKNELHQSKNMSTKIIEENESCKLELRMLRTELEEATRTKVDMNVVSKLTEELESARLEVRILHTELKQASSPSPTSENNMVIVLQQELERVLHRERTFDTQIQSLQDELNRVHLELQQSYSFKDSSTSNNNTSNTNSNNNSTDYTLHISQLKNELSKLSIENETNRGKYQDVLKENELQLGEISYLNQHMQDSNMRISELEKQLIFTRKNELDHFRNDLQLQYTSPVVMNMNGQKSSSPTHSNSTSTSTINYTEESHVELQSQLNKITSELTTSKAEESYIRQELEASVNRCNKLERELEVAKNEISKLSIQLDNSIGKTSENVSAMEHWMNCLQHDLMKSNHKIKELEIELIHERAEITKLRPVNSDLMMKIEKYQLELNIVRTEDIPRLQAAIQEKNHTIHLLQQDVVISRQEREESSNQVGVIQNELDITRSELTSLRMDNTGSCRELDILRIEISALREKLRESESKQGKNQSDIQSQLITLQLKFEEENRFRLDREHDLEIVKAELNAMKDIAVSARQALNDNIPQSKAMEFELGTWKAEVSRLQDSLGKSAIKIKLLEKDLEASKIQINELQNEVENVKCNKTTNEQTENILKHEMITLQKKFDDDNKEYNIIKTNLESQISEKDLFLYKAQNEISTLKNEISSLKNEISNLKNEISTLKSELHTAENKVSKSSTEAQEEIQRLSQSLEIQQENNENELNNSKNEILRLQKELETFQNKSFDHTKEIERSKSEYTLLMRELGRSVSKSTEFEKELSLLKLETNKIENTNQLLENSQKSIEKLQKELESTQNSLKETEQEAESLRVQLPCLRADISESNVTIEKIRNENNSIQMKYETCLNIQKDFENQINLLKKEKLILQESINKLNIQLIGKDNEIDSTRIEIKKLSSELDSSYAKTNGSEVELDKLKSDLPAINSEIQRLTNIILEQNKSVEMYHSELEISNKKLVELQVEVGRWKDESHQVNDMYYKQTVRTKELENAIEISKSEASRMKSEMERCRMHFSVSLPQSPTTSTPMQIDAPYILCRRDLERITDNFSENRIVGRGASSIVYCGQLGDKALAVKKLEGPSTELRELQFEQFTREILVSNWRHEHLLSVLGVCLDPESVCLVYPLVEHGSLQDALNDPQRRSQLNWKLRLRLAIGVTVALHYLHTPNEVNGKPQIVHRDVKPANILLGGSDGSHALLSDAGIARNVDKDLTFANTSAMGTPGYIDPLHMRTGDLNFRSDIYSLGIVLLQLLTGVPIAVDRSLSPPALIARMEPFLEKESYVVAESGIWPPSVAVGLGRLIQSCLSLHIADRPESCEVIFNTLKQLNSIAENIDNNSRHNGSVHKLSYEHQRPCAICLGERPIDTRIHPCLHSCLCHADATALMQFAGCCPLCSVRIQRIERGNFEDTISVRVRSTLKS